MLQDKKILLHICGWLSGVCVLISPVAANDYLNNILNGEYLAPDLASSYDPLFSVNKNNRQIIFSQSKIEKNAVDSLYPDHLNFLEQSFFPELLLAQNCPDGLMGKHYDYIRYVFRLLTMSYLFETLKEFDVLFRKENSLVCSFKWEDLFEKCKPTSTEMKKFIRRLEPAYIQAYKVSNVHLLKDDAYQKWNKVWCSSGQVCPIENQARQICEKGRALITNLCNETDMVYGLSFVPEAARILKTSNVMNIINREGHGLGCIDRFVSLFQDIEDKYYWLKDIFPVIFKRNIANRVRYLEGELFLPGALREFDEKGLGDFLFKPRPVVEKKVEQIIPMVTIIDEKPIPVTSPTPMMIPLPVNTPLVEAKKVQINLSEFEAKVKMRFERDLSKLALDMIAFSKEFIFDEKTLEKYDENLKDYYSRTALTDMLYYDHLGSKEEPVRLKFLKYLIDSDKHQGLFNLQAIIGEDFYVLNDFENKTIPAHIRIENSEKTNYRWQIYILE